jgi:hypothetical protein
LLLIVWLSTLASSRASSLPQLTELLDKYAVPVGASLLAKGPELSTQKNARSVEDRAVLLRLGFSQVGKGTAFTAADTVDPEWPSG